MQTSSNVAYGVYDCGWESWESISMKKSILIVLVNAQKNVKLTTKFMPINMELFYDVIF
jgi:hypothetical protein